MVYFSVSTRTLVSTRLLRSLDVKNPSTDIRRVLLHTNPLAGGGCNITQGSFRASFDQLRIRFEPLGKKFIRFQRIAARTTRRFSTNVRLVTSRIDLYLLRQPKLLGHSWSGTPSRLICIVVGLNIAVFMAWQYALSQKSQDPRLFESMMRNFTLGGFESIVNEGAWFGVLGANFSHMHIAHIALNLMALVSFGDFVLYHIGNVKNFVLFYTLSCLTTSIFSMGYKAAYKKRGYGEARSLGASGVVMGVMTLFALINPHAKLSLFGLITAPAYVFVGGIVIYSVWQSAMPSSRNGIVDVAGHVGGAFGGIVYWVFNNRTSSPFQFLRLLRHSSPVSPKNYAKRPRTFRSRRMYNYVPSATKGSSIRLLPSPVRHPSIVNFLTTNSLSNSLARTFVYSKNISQHLQKMPSTSLADKNNINVTTDPSLALGFIMDPTSPMHNSFQNIRILPIIC